MPRAARHPAVPPTLGSTLLVLAAGLLALYLFYLFYGLVHRAFQRVGFTSGEAGAILLGTLVLGFVNVPLAQVNGWTLAINLGGGVVPIVISYILLRRFPGIGMEATVGVVLVALVTYLVTQATPQGIVSPFPLWLAPPLVAGIVSALSFWRDETSAAPVAYVGGSLGALIGADVLRLGEFLSQPPPTAGAAASIGGAAVLDMVFLTGILAVALDMLVFRELRRSGILGGGPEEGPVVFRMGTSPEAIRDYDPASDAARVRALDPRARR